MFGFVNLHGRLKGGRTFMRCQDREGGRGSFPGPKQRAAFPSWQRNVNSPATSPSCSPFPPGHPSPNSVPQLSCLQLSPLSL